MKIVLASQSPRREELLGRLVSAFDVHPADIDETPFVQEKPKDYVERMATEKAKVVKHQYDDDVLVIASDTTVVFNNEIIGKPADEKEAKAILQRLSGETHEVYTAVMLTKGAQEEKILAQAKVTFYSLTNKDIEAYLVTGDYMDKAGAYGIQSFAGAFVKEIQGDYYSIVGFPIGAVYQSLKKFM